MACVHIELDRGRRLESMEDALLLIAILSRSKPYSGDVNAMLVYRDQDSELVVSKTGEDNAA